MKEQLTSDDLVKTLLDLIIAVKYHANAYDDDLEYYFESLQLHADKTMIDVKRYLKEIK